MARLAQDHAGITGSALDVLDAEAVAALVVDLQKINVLVNCAGWVHHGTILDCDDDAWDRAFVLNARATFRLTRAVLSGMLDRGAGSIVNIASIVSIQKDAPLCLWRVQGRDHRDDQIHRRRFP